MCFGFPDNKRPLSNLESIPEKSQSSKMYCNASVIIVAASLLLLPIHSPAIAAAPAEIFILAGQSNMAGRGGVDGGKWDGFVPPESKPNPAILRLDARGVWRRAHEPLHADIDVHKACGVGPGLAFANAVRLLGRGPGRANRVIGLVPCAVGGTRIGQWGNGTELYGAMVRRAREAVERSGAGGRIKAVLWYQGESDTVDADDAESYGAKMEKLIVDLRNDLSDPSLLIIQVALASGEGEYIEKVRRAQLGIKLCNVKTVDANGLELGLDGLHLSTKAQARLGFKLALAFLGLDSSFPRFTS